MPPENAGPGERTSQPYRDELAQLYDVAVPDWPGELEFYRRLARQMPPDHRSILEVACGTGRVAIALAHGGVRVVGIDLSQEMLAIARSKSAELANVHWICDDMRTFDLEERFGLAILPAYSFQLLLTEDDQAACLRQLARHMAPDARLVLHLETHDPNWLASLPSSTFTAFKPSGVAIHPITGQPIRVSYAWSRDPAACLLSVNTRYEVLESPGRPSARQDRGPLKMYCTSPSSLERLLAQSGLETEAVYGDFFGHSFHEEADEMIWVAKREH